MTIPRCLRDLPLIAVTTISFFNKKGVSFTQMRYLIIININVIGTLIMLRLLLREMTGPSKSFLFCRLLSEGADYI